MADQHLVDTIQEYATGIYHVAMNFTARREFYRSNIWPRLAEIENDGLPKRKLRKVFMGMRFRSQQQFCANLKNECDKINREIIEPIVSQYNLPIEVKTSDDVGFFGLLCIYEDKDLSPAALKREAAGDLFAPVCQLTDSGSLRQVVEHNHDIFLADVFSIVNYLKYHSIENDRILLNAADRETEEIADRFKEATGYCDNWVNVMAKKCLLQDVAQINHMKNDFTPITDQAFIKYWSTIYRDIPPDRTLGKGKGRVVDIASTDCPAAFRRHSFEYMAGRHDRIWIEDRKIVNIEKAI